MLSSQVQYLLLVVQPSWTTGWNGSDYSLYYLLCHSQTNNWPKPPQPIAIQSPVQFKLIEVILCSDMLREWIKFISGSSWIKNAPVENPVTNILVCWWYDAAVKIASRFSFLTSSAR